MHTVYVKGNVVEVIEAVTLRALRFHWVDIGQGHNGTTAVRVSDREGRALEKLVRWMAEPPVQGPYPVGTLLWYRENDKGIGE